ncbi:hypothetical protein BDA99DRAFT_514488 [Phascolomyces articulosus]|uniref:DUF1308 domain-containing protein n=1 Tax=Phascolomyces articulosus TaxID=60185 RepID=A0AAD5JXI2_9FUNG|nr:hypothetical protein BDA99DRAFT_514488 [Phascolomyces articulosus]
MASDEQESYAAVQSLRERCKFILRDCQERDAIEGMYRYTHSLTAEMGFLDKLIEDPSRIKKEYIQSSNLSYLEAVHEAITQTRQLDQIMELKSVPPKDQEGWVPRAALMRRRQTVKVDLVSEHGLVWIKVIARNAKGLRFDMAGLELLDDDDDEDDDGFLGYDDSDDDDKQKEESLPPGIVGNDPFDDLPIFRKAKQYLTSAEAHPVHFQTPRVIFAFMRLQPQGQDEYVERILERLRELGIHVHVGAEGLLDSYYATHPHSKCRTTSSLNLDVSTTLALISEMSHHPCLPDQVLGEALQIQARREQEAPILPLLISIVRNKQLFMVQSAYDRLVQIVNVVGGPTEQARFRQLFDQEVYDPSYWTSFSTADEQALLPLRIQVLPDQPSERFRGLLEPPAQKNLLNNGRKIRSRFSEFHAVIFGSGDSYRMTTVTAIQWMQQALLDASLTGTAIVSHEPRSLSEQKMYVACKKTQV